MSRSHERQAASTDALPEDFTPEELSFLKAESNFLSYYIDEIGNALGLGEMKFTVLRDSSVLVGYRADRNGALLRSKHESLQDAVNQLI